MKKSRPRNFDRLLDEVVSSLSSRAASESISALTELSVSDALRAHVDNALQDDQALERLAAEGQIHPNSFVKYTFGTSSSSKLVLHVWSRPEADPEIHNHRWDFVSTVLRGRLMADTIEVSSGLGSFNEYVYHSPAASDSMRLDYVGPRILRIAKTSVLESGTTYFQDYRDIHRARVEDDTTISLIVQGPVRQLTTRVFSTRTIANGSDIRRVHRPDKSTARKHLIRLRSLLEESQ